MKLLFGTQSWLNALWVLVALLSGPTVVASVWLVAAIAAEAGFVVLPDGAPRFSGPKGREADVTFGFAEAIFIRYFGELTATRVTEIENAPNIEDLRLPWFVETKSFFPGGGSG